MFNSRGINSSSSERTGLSKREPHQNKNKNKPHAVTVIGSRWDKLNTA